MDLQTEKFNIIKWLENVNDEAVIRRFLILKKSSEHTTEPASPEQREAIDRSIDSIEAGRFKSDAEVKRITREKFPNLF